MKPQITATSRPFFTASQPEGVADEVLVEEDVLQETLHQYSSRFLWLGAAIVVLLAVVFYLYQSRVGSPVAQLEGDVQTQVVTQPLPPETAPIASQAMEATPPAPAPERMNTASQPADYNVQTVSMGQGIECPVGTSRMIYIGEQALCCQGDVCTEAN